MQAGEKGSGRGPYPPWIMKSGMQRCMTLPLKCSFLPDLPMPRSPVHRHLKFSAVFGTTSASNAMTILHSAHAFQHTALSMNSRLAGPDGLSPTCRWALLLFRCLKRP